MGGLSVRPVHQSVIPPEGLYPASAEIVMSFGQTGSAAATLRQGNFEWPMYGIESAMKVAYVSGMLRTRLPNIKLSQPVSGVPESW